MKFIGNAYSWELPGHVATDPPNGAMQLFSNARNMNEIEQ